MSKKEFKDVIMAESAVVRGDVEMGAGCTVWHNATIRGDMAPIRIGKETNIQDNAVVHVDYGFPTDIGDGVTVGHSADRTWLQCGGGFLFCTSQLQISHETNNRQNFLTSVDKKSPASKAVG